MSITRCEFRKMVYEKFFRKPFFKILLRFLRSTENVCMLILILQRNKRPKMMKIFYGKRSTLKQTEPNMEKRHPKHKVPIHALWCVRSFPLS